MLGFYTFKACYTEKCLHLLLTRGKSSRSRDLPHQEDSVPKPTPKSWPGGCRDEPQGRSVQMFCRVCGLGVMGFWRLRVSRGAHVWYRVLGTRDVVGSGVVVTAAATAASSSSSSSSGSAGSSGSVAGPCAHAAGAVWRCGGLVHYRRLELCSGNGKENGNYYSILGLHGDNVSWLTVVQFCCWRRI